MHEWRWRLLALFPFILLPPDQIVSSVPDRIQEQRVFPDAPNQSGAVSYLYIEGNESGAGGGHTALRIGDSVFHYQRVPEGFFILDRTPWDGFRFSYSRLQNRNIHESVLRTTEPQKEALLRRFTDLMVQHRWMLRKRSEKIRKLERLQAMLSTGTTDVAYPSLGYFRGDRKSALWAELKDMQLRFDDRTVSDALPGDDDEIEDFLENSLTQLIENGFDFHDDAFCITELRPQPETLDRTRRILKSRLKAAFLASAKLRPDRARTALELMVLLESVRRSKESGYWVIPRMALINERHAGRSGETGVVRPRLKLDNPELVIFARMYRGRLADFNRIIMTAEAANAVTALNRLYQSAAILDLAMEHGTGLALASGALLTTPSLALVQKRDFADVERLSVELVRGRREYEALDTQMREELSYSLFTENCVTELLREFALVTGVDLHLESPFLSGLFVPFISETYVSDALGTGERITHLSFRNDLLDTEPSLREASTLTSRYYSYNERDSLFLFFTEDHVAVRPLAGIVNLSLGTVQTLEGGFTAPFDRGLRFARGIRGMSFSLTEVFWISVRKGTFRSDHPLFYSFPSSITRKKKVTVP